MAQGLLLNLDLMGQPECYFSSLAEELEGKRDRLAAILKDTGMTPVIPEGGYFMLVDVSSLSELLTCLQRCLLGIVDKNISVLLFSSPTAEYSTVLCVHYRGGRVTHG